MNDIMELTLAQFNDRLGDIFIMNNHFQGDGKGRLVVESLEEIQSKSKVHGIKGPSKRVKK